MPSDVPSKPLDDAHAILVVYDELMRHLTTGLIDLHARTRDLEDQVDRAGAEVARRGERLRELGEPVERTQWDRPKNR
ncbi:MAG TPA: hypothetical protein VNO30_04085 [Kofleriaceae bacterium]|nr:hypothetical protein [Kofleriaceae bacterium]